MRVFAGARQIFATTHFNIQMRTWHFTTKQLTLGRAFLSSAPAERGSEHGQLP